MVATHVGAVVVLAAALFAPLYAGWRTLTPLVTLASLQGWASGPRLVARGTGALGRALVGHGGGVALATLTYAVFLAAFAGLWWRVIRRVSIESTPAAWGVTLLAFALAAPYLLPWYAAWFMPFVALMTDEGLALIALVIAAALALTGVPAEPGSAPGLWQAMLLGVHYGVAPVMLALFVGAARRILMGSWLEVARLQPGGPRRPERRPTALPGRRKPAGSA
jgi:hypothetical protein